MHVAARRPAGFAGRPDLPSLETCFGRHPAGDEVKVNDRLVVGLVRAGGGSVRIGAVTRPLVRGDVVVARAGTVTHTRWHVPSEVAVAFVLPEELPPHATHCANGLAVVPDPDLGALAAALDGALRSAADTLLLQGMIEDLVARAARHLGASPASRGRREPRAVQRAIELLHEGFAQGITLDDLARETGLNKHYLHKAFRAHVGMPPHAYLAEIRMNHARRLIRAGTPLGDVALSVGFCDQSHLTRAFRAAHGITPGAYAQMVAAPRGLSAMAWAEESDSVAPRPRRAAGYSLPGRRARAPRAPLSAAGPAA